MDGKHDRIRQPLRYVSWKSLNISATALILTLFLATGIVTIPRGLSAHAASASIVLNPTSAHYSPLYSSIIVQGSNYAAHETVNVYWNYTGPGTGTLETSATTDGTGAFIAQFVTPLAPTKTYTVAGVGQTSNRVATAPFLLLPMLALSPNASGPTTQLTITGNAYGNGEKVKIYWNYTGPGTGTLLTTATANKTGSFTATATVPASATPGTIPVGGVGKTTQAVAKNNYIFYPLSLLLAPTAGSATTALTVSAYGFQGLEKVKIYWNNAPTPIATGTTDSFGLNFTSFNVPAGAAPGSYPVKAVGQSTGVSVTNMFSVVAPASSLNLTTGPVGATVGVTGEGYTPNEQVNILWNYTGPGTGTQVASVNAGYAGTIGVNFAVPTASRGAYPVAAIGTTSNSITTSTFSVANSLASSPASSPPGTNVTVDGTGYKSQESVKLYWDSTSGALLATATATNMGNISKSVILPTNATPGSHSIIGVGQTSGKSFTAAVTIDTAWNDFGFDTAHHRVNAFENTLNTSNVSQLKLKWSANTTTLFKASPVYANGLVYFCTADGKLDAYNAITGVSQWQFDSNTGFKCFSSPLVDPVNGLVFFGTVGRDGSGIPGPFFGLDAQTGAVKWGLILSGNVYSFPTLVGQTLYIATSNEGSSSSFLSIDDVSGHILWQQSATGGIWGAIGVDTVSNALFSIVGNPVDEVVSLNATTGAYIWQHPLPTFSPDDDPSSGITVDNGMVYVNDKNGNEYALDENTGHQVWSTAIGNEFTNVLDVSTQAVSNGVLYVGSQDNNLYALNAATGTVKWTLPTGNGIDSSPAVANGVVYFASFDNKIYAANASNGTVLWSYATGNASYSSPIVVNGWLYCGSTDGKLYAFSM